MMNNTTLINIDIEKIFPHPDNPRKDLGDLSELAESIKARGIMQNLTVVPKGEGEYTVIIGHRRLSAARMAGLSSVPCVIANLSEREQLGTMLLENMQRSDLTVYEQAKGFQLMISLGESVSTIAEKTGMSETTVRRRVKMAELDSETLKEVSSRQLSLSDFDALAKIDDIETRNDILKDIGTNNFNHRYISALRKQNIAKALPGVKEELKALKANKITRSETYGQKYERVGLSVRIHEREDGEPLISEANIAKVNGKLFYYLDEDYGNLSFYQIRPKAAPVKKSKKEIEREAYIADARAKLSALTSEFYELRKAFVDNIKVTAKNKDKILEGAVVACAYQVVTYVGSDSTGLYKHFDISINASNYDERRNQLVDLIESDTSTYPAVIYAAFGDCPANGYTGGYKYEYPFYNKNAKLDVLYAWLEAMGYEMSNEEKALANGTHDLFKDKDKEGKRK